MKIDVIEDYLEPSDFEQLKTTLLKDEFPWFLSTIVNGDDTLAPDWNTQMVHRFYDNNVPTSSFLQALDPVFTRIISCGMSTFPTFMRHTGTTCTDASFRLVLNFNYAI